MKKIFIIPLALMSLMLTQCWDRDNPLDPGNTLFRFTKVAHVQGPNPMLTLAWNGDADLYSEYNIYVSKGDMNNFQALGSSVLSNAAQVKPMQGGSIYLKVVARKKSGDTVDSLITNIVFYNLYYRDFEDNPSVGPEFKTNDGSQTVTVSGGSLFLTSPMMGFIVLKTDSVPGGRVTVDAVTRITNDVEVWIGTNWSSPKIAFRPTYATPGVEYYIYGSTWTNVFPSGYNVGENTWRMSYGLNGITLDLTVDNASRICSSVTAASTVESVVLGRNVGGGWALEIKKIGVAAE
ncbi:MAG: hypothetical protein HZC28_05665 [Spirochaetes bacterium]|nr:hypothetical protein [Spirochaetota bacterium]